MAVQAVPGFIGQAGFQHPVELMRNINRGIWNRSGVLKVGDFALTPGGSSLQVVVAAGRAHIVGVENATQGGYFVWSEASETKVLGAAVGNPRIDTILLRVEDGQYGTISGQPEAYVDVVQGVAAASPTARPDSDFNSGGAFYVPGAWFRLGDVRVNVGDGVLPSGQFTHNLRYVRGASGIHIAKATDSITDQAAWDFRVNTDTKGIQQYDPATASWREPYFPAMRAEIRRTATLLIPIATWTAVTFDDDGSGARDPFGMWSSGSNPTRITVPSGGDGRWKVRGFVPWQFQTSGYRGACFTKNGTSLSSAQGRLGLHTLTFTNGLETVNHPYQEMDLVAGDYLELFVIQNHSSSVDCAQGGGNTPRLFVTMERMGPAWG